METELYDIHVCRVNEYDKLVEFIDKHWIHNHIFIYSKSLLDFQHLDKEKGVYNFVIALNKKTKEIDAIQGFIPTALYDSSLEKYGNYWSSIWKRRDDIKNAESSVLGIMVLSYVFEMETFRTYGSIGLSQDSINMYEALGLLSGILNQYYIANSEIDNYIICKNPEIKPISGYDESIIRKVSIDEVNVEAYYMPLKSKKFIITRYAKHPIWHYDFYVLEKAEGQVALFVTRSIDLNGARCIRIVDALGDLSKVGYIANGLKAIMQKEHAEYIDFMNYGIDDEVFYRMGLSKLNPDCEDIIIPNYFEPFLQKNIKVKFGIKADSDYVIFKADGDQDRPSKI